MCWRARRPNRRAKPATGWFPSTQTVLDPGLVRLGRLGAVTGTRAQSVQNGPNMIIFACPPLYSAELKTKNMAKRAAPCFFSRTALPMGPNPTPRSPWARPAARELAYRAWPTGTLPYSEKRQASKMCKMNQKNDYFRLSPLCSVELKTKTWQNVPPRVFLRTTYPMGPKPTPQSPWAQPAARELTYRAWPTGTPPNSEKRQRGDSRKTIFGGEIIHVQNRSEGAKFPF